jgi:phage-related baseplate assembly protein
MSFTAISLDKAGTPQVIPQLPFGEVFAARKARFIELAEARDDAEYLASVKAALDLESEGLVQLLQEDSWRELVVRQDVQDAGLGNMLAFATGPALDHLAAFYGVARQIVQEADATATPPIPEIWETDERLRKRTQLAPEGFTTNGTRGAYVFWGLSASPLVKDIGVSQTETPGEVRITVLSTEGNGTPDAALLARVDEELTARKPLNAALIIEAASITPYTIAATLTLYEGPGAEPVLEAATETLKSFVTRRHQLGHDVVIAGLNAALYQEGVQNVDLGGFASDLIVGPREAAWCDPEVDISVTIGGRNV